MARLYLVADRAEIERRRVLVNPSRLVEVWQDLHTPDVFWLGNDELRRIAYGQPGDRSPAGFVWMGETSKALLDAADDRPLPFQLALPAEAVPVYYGPRLTDVDSLPSEESLRARVLSAHGIAVLWCTYDPTGARAEFQPDSPTEPTFYLRRPRGAVVHLWRLFCSQAEALSYATERWARDPEATRWAEALPATDFPDLVSRFGARG